jgi:hypothetical protein
LILDGLNLPGTKFEFEITVNLDFSESSSVGAIPKCFDSQFRYRILLDQFNLITLLAVGSEGVYFSSNLRIDGQILIASVSANAFFRETQPLNSLQKIK